MVKLAEVVTLYDSNASQIPAMLRKRADAIEAETERDDRTVAMIAVEVTDSGDLEIYGWAIQMTSIALAFSQWRPHG